MDHTKILDKVLPVVKDYMTIADVSEEYGIPNQTIRSYCRSRKINLPGPKDVLKIYLRSMEGKKTVSELVKLTGYNEDYLRRIFREMGEYVYLSEPKKAEPVLVELPEETKTEMSYLLRLEEPGERFKDHYTQSGSPYGIADEMK